MIVLTIALTIIIIIERFVKLENIWKGFFIKTAVKYENT